MNVMRYEHDPRSEAVIGSAIDVHRTLGPGLLEKTYEECLCFELDLRRIPYRRQVPIPVIYKSINLECGFRADLLFENALVVELKAVESLSQLHTAQLLTYMKFSRCLIGLLLNFNVSRLRDGIRRLAL